MGKSEFTEDIELTGSRTVQETVIMNYSIAAGGVVNLSAQVIDLSGFNSLGLLCKANTSHTFNVQALHSPDGTTIYTGNPTIALSGASTTKSGVGLMVTEHSIIQISNMDTVSHTYDLWIRKMNQ